MWHICVLLHVQFPLWPGVLIAVTWWSSVCFSRIYLGVHTVLVRITRLLHAMICVQLESGMHNVTDLRVSFFGKSLAVQ